jgi:transcription elongation factor GreA
VVEADTTGRIGIGSRVEVESDGERSTLTLVGSAESDPGSGRISAVSPVGRALLGHHAGDEVAVRTPRGEAHYRVVSVG